MAYRLPGENFQHTWPCAGGGKLVGVGMVSWLDHHRIYTGLVNGMDGGCFCKGLEYMCCCEWCWIKYERQETRSTCIPTHTYTANLNRFTGQMNFSVVILVAYVLRKLYSILFYTTATYDHLLCVFIDKHTNIFLI